MQKDDIIAEAVKIIHEYINKDDKVVLFGSWARGDALATSDLDIGILGKEKIPWDTMVKILGRVRAIPTLRKIDIVDLSAKEKSFRDGVLSYGKFL